MDFQATQRQRKNLVRQMCERYGLKSNMFAFPRIITDRRTVCEQDVCPFFVVRRRSYLFCLSQKVGSTNLKQALYKFEFRGHNLNKNIHQHANTEIIQASQSYFNETELKKMFKVISTRHPFGRLASVYTDKARRYADNRIYYRMHYVPFLTEHGLLRENYKATGITFREFALYLAGTPAQKYNHHWMTIYDRCQPCNVHFDFIGSYETRDDYNHISEDFKPSEENHLHSTTKTRELKKLYDQLTWKEISSLYQIYKYDFDLFGFTVDDFIRQYGIKPKNASREA